MKYKKSLLSLGMTVIGTVTFTHGHAHASEEMSQHYAPINSTQDGEYGYVSEEGKIKSSFQTGTIENSNDYNNENAIRINETSSKVSSTANTSTTNAPKTTSTKLPQPTLSKISSKKAVTPSTTAQHVTKNVNKKTTAPSSSTSSVNVKKKATINKTTSKTTSSKKTASSQKSTTSKRISAKSTTSKAPVSKVKKKTMPQKNKNITKTTKTTKTTKSSKASKTPTTQKAKTIKKVSQPVVQPKSKASSQNAKKSNKLKTKTINKSKVTPATTKKSSVVHSTSGIAASKVKTTSSYTLGKVKPTDYYRSMTDLLNDTQEGKDWTKESTNRNSNVLIFAPHGGNIEKGTTELAKAIANKGNYDYYAFNGVRNKNNSQLHVTSTNYNDSDLIHRNYNKDVSISVYGAGQAQGTNTVLIGGRDEKLIQLITRELSAFKFNVKRGIGHLAGLDPNNVVNYNKKGQGVQLELTPDLRKSLFNIGDDSSKVRKNEKNWTSTMDHFATAINNAIQKYMI
ncbi:phage replication-related protein YjqB (UPF0714/DUF867 family) [Staphylococcus hominis]